MKTADLLRIADQLAATSDLVRSFGAQALATTEDWKPGAKTANLDPDKGGDRYETVVMPNQWGVQTTTRVRVPSNDPTGEHATADKHDPTETLHDELVQLLDRMHRDAHRAQRILTSAVPQRTGLQKPQNETGADVALAGWCRSCHRDSGYCEPVATRKDGSRRYSDFCNYCGEWTAAYGKEPPLELVRARHEGRRVTSAMVDRALRRTHHA